MGRAILPMRLISVLGRDFSAQESRGFNAPESGKRPSDGERLATVPLLPKEIVCMDNGKGRKTLHASFS